jgi:hypothetical protein
MTDPTDNAKNLAAAWAVAVTLVEQHAARLAADELTPGTGYAMRDHVVPVMQAKARLALDAAGHRGLDAKMDALHQLDRDQRRDAALTVAQREVRNTPERQDQADMLRTERAAQREERAIDAVLAAEPTEDPES